MHMPLLLNVVCFVVKNMVFHLVEYQQLVPHAIVGLQIDNSSGIDHTLYSSNRNERLDGFLTFM